MQKREKAYVSHVTNSGSPALRSSRIQRAIIFVCSVMSAKTCRYRRFRLFRLRKGSDRNNGIQRVAGILCHDFYRDAYAPDRESERSEERRVGKECRSRWSPY